MTNMRTCIHIENGGSNETAVPSTRKKGSPSLSGSQPHLKKNMDDVLVPLVMRVMRAFYSNEPKLCIVVDLLIETTA